MRFKAAVILMPVFWFSLAIFLPVLILSDENCSAETPLYLFPRTAVKGHRYHDAPLVPSVKKTLGAKEFLNGHFYDAMSNRFSVFSASWEKENGLDGSVFHVPDGCWIGDGFQPTQLGLPSEFSIEFFGQRVPFQCRTFTHPNLRFPELAIWCACVDGKWDKVRYAPAPNLSNPNIDFLSYCKQTLNYISARWTSLKNLALTPPSECKQFHRISMPINGDVNSAIKKMELFALDWLTMSGDN
jgi:hypothetical protein